MYTVEFYENDRGVSELWDFLEELRIKSASNKDARIQYKQIVLYIQLLQDNGTRLSENVTKHLMDGIWELRPGIAVSLVMKSYWLRKLFTLSWLPNDWAC